MARITLEMYDKKFSFECKHDDLTATECLEAFKALMIGETFLEDTVIDAMNEIVEEYKDYRSYKNEDCCDK